VAGRKNPEGKMPFRGHLIELRKRLVWSAAFIVAGAVGGWFLFDPVFALLQQPVIDLAKEENLNASVNFGTIIGAFDLRIQVSIFLGVFVSSPIWLYQLWAFVTPALKRREKKFTLIFLFSAVPLFLAGCAFAWVSFPTFVRTLLGFTPEGSANVISANEYVLFALRILLVFGVTFVMPVVLVLLNFIGVLSAKSIIKSWRVAILVIALVAALATPTADPMSMLLVMLPLILFYFVSALIAWLHDRIKAKRDKSVESTD
jgi:sec-independent protein translocase protein TatC